MGAVSSPPYFSVIIAGAGPTGLTAANLLGMLGIDALVLERNSGLSDCPKAIAIDDEGLRHVADSPVAAPVRDDAAVERDLAEQCHE